MNKQTLKGFRTWLRGERNFGASDSAMYQLMERIALGELSDGDSLDSIKREASRLAVKASATASAYRKMQLVGILEAKQGAGHRVATGATAMLRPILEAHVDEAAERLARQAKALGTTLVLGADRGDALTTEPPPSCPKHLREIWAELLAYSPPGVLRHADTPAVILACQRMDSFRRNSTAKESAELRQALRLIHLTPSSR